MILYSPAAMDPDYEDAIVPTCDGEAHNYDHPDALPVAAFAFESGGLVTYLCHGCNDALAAPVIRDGVGLSGQTHAQIMAYLLHHNGDASPEATFTYGAWVGRTLPAPISID